MSSPRTSLNVSIDWSRVLDVLGLSLSQSQVLPGLGKCPRCRRNHLVILPDRASGGQWHWCRKCQIHGDMIELAARAWDMTLVGTIQRLRREGFEISTAADDIKCYIENTVKYRVRMKDLWKQARQNIFQHSVETGSLLQKLSLRTPTEQPRWDQSCGQMVGCMNNHDVEQLMRPNSWFLNKKKGWQKAAATSVFRGRNWGDVLVFPMFDLPHRIRAFLFVGRNADPEKDFVFRLCHLGAVGGHAWVDRRCSGLIMHPGVLTAESEIILAFDDPLLSYRLQQRHFRLSSKALPVVSYRDVHPHRPRKAWEMFGDRQLVFWAPDNPASAFCQAIENNGLVSLTKPEVTGEQQMQQYLSRMSPADLVGRIHHTAVPWQRAVARHLDTCDDNDVEELVSQLQLAEINVAAAAEQLPRQARERLQNILFKDRASRTITMEQKQVIEKPGGWFLNTPRHGDELILNAHIRIDYVVQHKRVQRTYYRGRVIWKGESLPFVCLKKDFDRNPFSWVEQFLLDNGKGLLQYAKSWSSRAVLLATQFHQPEFVFGTDYVGYDCDEQRMLLPHYEIRLGGEVREHEHGIASGPLPANLLEKPETISPQELDAIDHPTAWATVVSLLANVLAPAMDQELQGLGLLGAGADSIAKDTCEALGCISHRLRSRTQLESLRDVEAMHGWPIIVEAAVGKRLAGEWIDPDRRAEPHNCVMLLDWYTFHAKKLLGDWHLLHDPAPARLSEGAAVSLRRLIPAYLRDLMERHLEMTPQEPAGGSWWAQVHADLSAFVRRHYGDTGPLAASQGLYLPSGPQDQADAFADLVGEFARTGRFLVVPEGFQDETKPTLVTIDQVMGEEALLVPKVDFVQLLQKKEVAIFDGGKVTRALADAGVLLEDRDSGWVIQRKWWSERLRIRTAEESGMLKLHAG